MILILLVNKNKGIFGTKEQGNNTLVKSQTIKRIATADIFNNIKESLLAQKGKLESEANKKSSKVNLNIPAEEVSEDVVDFDDYDEEDLDIEILKPNIFTLTLAKNKRGNFEIEIEKYTRKFNVQSFFGLIIISLIQTSLLIGAEGEMNEFDYLPAIIILRYLFPVILLLLIIFNNFITRKSLKGKLVLLTFLYGSAVSIFHGTTSGEAIYQTIQVIEVMLINTVGIYAG